MNPLISVIILTHNRSSMLRQAIESVVAQIIDKMEIIVVADNSSDDTSQVYISYPVCYIKTSKGKPSATQNVGISIAKGKYICFLDDDDIFLTGWIKEAYN